MTATCCAPGRTRSMAATWSRVHQEHGCDLLQGASGAAATCSRVHRSSGDLLQCSGCIWSYLACLNLYPARVPCVPLPFLPLYVREASVRLWISKLSKLIYTFATLTYDAKDEKKLSMRDCGRRALNKSGAVQLQPASMFKFR